MNTKRHGHIVLFGGTGFLGQRLRRFFAGAGYEVVVISRGGEGRRCWDGKTQGAWAGYLEGAAAAINLAGKHVNCRYTRAALAEIDGSRTDSVAAVGEAIRRCASPPPVWVQAGSLAIYGDAGEAWCDESHPAGKGIPPRTCLKWEAAFAEEAVPQTRKVMLRIGFVLGRDGGALGTLEKLVRAYLGGAAGSGRQYISWLHPDDFCRIVQHAIDTPASGIYNACAPEPVTNAEFMRLLRAQLGKPWSPPVPGILARIGAFFMRTEAVLALTGRRGAPKRLWDDGFRFEYSDCAEALAAVYAEPPPNDE